MTIRCVAAPGSVRDRWLEVLERLDRACFDGDPPPNWERAWWWVAWSRGAPVAFAGLAPITPGAANGRHGVGYLCRAGVVPAARGQGLQRRMIRVREAAARRAGMRELITYTSRENTKSANNLIACGYRLYTPPEEWGLEGAFYFCRRL
jgi:GNAT superfamily N-acetyltransferase